MRLYSKLALALLIAATAVASAQNLGPPGGGGGGAPTGAAGGGLTGTYPNPTVATNANLTGGVTSVGNAATVVTNANLTGDVTSVGNATTLTATARLKSKIITGTRDLTAATGNVVYTGVGFQPTSCLANGSVAASLTQYVSIIGFSDSSAQAQVSAVGASVVNTAQLGKIMLFQDTTGTSFQTAGIVSYDADGLTLGWTKNGTPTGTANFTILCYR